MNYETFIIKDNNESNVNTKNALNNNDELANKLRHAYSEILNTNSNKSFKRQLSFQKSNQSLNKINFSTNQDNNNFSSDRNTEVSVEKPQSNSNNQSDNSNNNNHLNQINTNPSKNNVVSSFRKFQITPTDESTIESSINRNYANRLRESSRKLLSQNISNKKPTQMSKEILKENDILSKESNGRPSSSLKLSENSQKPFEYNLQYLSSDELIDRELKSDQTQQVMSNKISMELSKQDIKHKEPSPFTNFNVSYDSLSKASKNYLHRKEKLQSAKIDLNQIDNQAKNNEPFQIGFKTSSKYERTMPTAQPSDSTYFTTQLNDVINSNESKPTVSFKEHSTDTKLEPLKPLQPLNNEASFDQPLISNNDGIDQTDQFYQMPQMIDIDNIYDSSINSMDMNNSSSTQSSSNNYNEEETNGNYSKSKSYLNGVPGFDKNLPTILVKPILKIQTNNDTLPSKSIKISTKSKKIKLDPISVILDAACEGDIFVIADISKQINDVSVANRLGATPLHLSICSFKYEATKLLIDLGADVNYSDINGWTPLHCAAFYCDLWTCKLLVSSGANVRATTLYDYKTPFDICRSKTYKDFNGSTKNEINIPVNDCLEFLIEEMDKLQFLKIGSIVYACYDHHKNMEDELTIYINDKLIVNNHPNGLKESGWIWVENSLQQCGFIPDNYISAYPKVQTDV